MTNIYNVNALKRQYNDIKKLYLDTKKRLKGGNGKSNNGSFNSDMLDMLDEEIKKYDRDVSPLNLSFNDSNTEDNERVKDPLGSLFDLDSDSDNNIKLVNTIKPYESKKYEMNRIITNPVYNLPTIDFSSITIKLSNSEMEEYLNKAYNKLSKNYGQQNCGIYIHKHQKMLIKCTDTNEYKHFRNKEALAYFPILYNIYNTRPFAYYIEQELVDGVITDIIFKDFIEIINKQYGKFYRDLMMRFLVRWYSDFNTDDVNHSFYIPSGLSEVANEKNIIAERLIKDFTQLCNNSQEMELIFKIVIKGIKDVLIGFKPKLDNLFINLEKTGHTYGDYKYDNVGYYSNEKLNSFDALPEYINQLKIKFIDPAGLYVPDNMQEIIDKRNNYIIKKIYYDGHEVEYYNFGFIGNLYKAERYINEKNNMIDRINGIFTDNNQKINIIKQINYVFDTFVEICIQEGLQ